MDVEPISFPGHVIALRRDGTSEAIATSGRPVRLDGFTFGVSSIESNPPHGGEMHPDGDELLYLVSGSLDLIVEEGGTDEHVGTETRTRFEAGTAVMVPKGLWHRVEINEPCQLVHVTPGPGDGHRPPRPSG
jgi:mannose-6-phosphate isomerase-like protein (cupin superfamily)